MIRASGTRPRTVSERPEPTLISAPPHVASFDIGGLRGEVRWDEDQWVAVDPFTGMFGEGDSYARALASLYQTLTEHRDDLERHAERLAPECADQLQARRRILPGDLRDTLERATGKLKPVPGTPEVASGVGGD